MTNATYTADSAATVSFDQVLDGLEAITDGTMSNPQTTTCTITVDTDVGAVVAVLTGTNFSYAGTGADLGLAGGTITKISLSLNGQHQGDVTGSLAVGDIINAVAAEEGGDTSAIEHFFMSFNWTYNGNDLADFVPPDLVIGDDVPFNLTGNDHISLGGGDDVFYSGDGNDTIDTGTGFDQVFAGNGNDTITAGVNAFVDAGDGDDTITTALYSTATPDSFVTVHGGHGKDTINAFTAGVYSGGAGDDRLISHATGDDDGDFMRVSYQNAPAAIFANLTATTQGTLAGGSDAGGFRISDGQGGTDLVSGFVALQGSAFGDQFRVDLSSYSSLYGHWLEVRPGAGDDNIVFTGASGSAIGTISYFGGAIGGGVEADLSAGTAMDLNPGDSFIGHDTFSGANGFRGTAFDDVILGSSADVKIRGETGNDFIKGGAGNEHLDGDDRSGNPDLTGDDTLVGGAGNDTLDGNNGYDVVDYGQDGGTLGVTVDLTTGVATDSFGDTDTLIGIEQVNGTDLADTMIGAIEGSSLYGNGGDDILSTGVYDATNHPDAFNLLDGGDGNDILNGYGPGYFRGGAGKDYLVAHETNNDDGNFMVAAYDHAAAGIFANLTSTTQGGQAGGDTEGYRVADGDGSADLVSQFVAFQDSAFNDQFVVDAGYTSLYGSQVEIRLSAGDDTVTIDPALEKGKVSYQGAAGGPVLADLQAGTATDLNSGDSFIGHDTFTGVDVFRATKFDDVVYGSDGNDLEIRGEAGNDTLYGRAGDDWLDGDDLKGNPTLTGNDTLVGGAGNDTLVGNNGDDILVGGTGIDRIDGGAGTDVVSLNGLHGGGFDIIQSGGIVYALDGVDHSYDIITTVEGFWGLSQAIALSDVRTFDPLAYAASYDDLAMAFRTDANAALSHYVAGGFFEHRHDSFDAAQYLANYADLRAAFGDDTHAATLHFLTGGVDEHRMADNPLDYIASYADLIGAFHGHSEAELETMGIAHYQAAGDAEGRRGGIDFDADQYLANYADLKAVFGDDDDAATAHFINSGYFEHRLWEDPLEYIASYADLIGAFHGQTESQMRASGIAHYQTGGFNEGREAGIDFNVDQYLANYADLRAAFADGHGGYNEDAAIYHYIEAGYFEGRTDHVLTA